MRRVLAILSATLGFAAVALAQPAKTGPSYEEEIYGKLPDKKDKNGKTIKGPIVTQYTLTNKNNLVVKCIEYGAIVTEIHVPDKNGKFADVALGFDKLDGYLKGHPYFGSNAGRCANRIAKGKFTLDGKEYTLATNNEPNHLHGGKEGFDKKYWKGEPFLGATGPGVKFTYTSPDGEEGYPGRLSVDDQLHADRQQRTRHRLPRDDRQADASATSRTTVTSTSPGTTAATILDHEAEFAAKNYTPADDTLIPTGKIEPVAGTPFDFTKKKAIGKDLEKARRQAGRLRSELRARQGQTERPEFAARVTEPKSGRVLEVLHDRAGLAVLHRQLPRRHERRQGRRGLQAVQRLLPRSAEVPGLGEQAGVEGEIEPGPQTGRDLQADDDLQVRRGEVIP